MLHVEGVSRFRSGVTRRPLESAFATTGDLRGYVAAVTTKLILHGAGLLGARTVHGNRWVYVSLADVQPPDGDRSQHHVVRLDRVAIALIVNRHGQVLMLWRYRFVVDQWGYVLLDGLVKPGEDPAVTAAREAEEESGWRPVGQPEHLTTFQPLPGIIGAQVDVYLWRDA